jgi:predicted flap endonuclease-1-like 5' DNA nuclease
MSLGNPTNIVIIVLLGLAAIMLLIASLTGGKKWRRLYDEEREEYASYAEGADTELRATRQRIAELERDHGTLQRQHAEALASIGTLKAEAAARPANVVPLAIVPPSSTPQAAFVAEPVAERSPVEPAVDEPAVTAAAIDEPLPVVPAAPRPIAPESVADSTDARPIASVAAALSELPPAPISGVTPLRAPEPAPDLRAPEAPLGDGHAEPAISPPVEAGGDTADLAPVAAEAPVIEDAVFEEVHEAPDTTEPVEPVAAAEVIAPLSHVAPETVAEAPVSEAPAVAAEPVTDIAAARDEPATPDPAPAPDLLEAAPDEPAKTWFGSGRRDDLTRLSGVEPLISNRLFALGVTTYDDIVQLSQEDEMALEQRLGVPAGFITREQWRTQAGLLRFGKEDEFNERFGKLEA